ELLKQGRGNRLGSSRHDNRIEGCMRFPARITVADFYFYVIIAQLLESCGGHFSMFWYDLDGVYLFHNLSQHSRLVARSGANLQYFHTWLGLDRLRHVSHH